MFKNRWDWRHIKTILRRFGVDAAEDPSSVSGYSLIGKHRVNQEDIVIKSVYKYENNEGLARGEVDSIREAYGLIPENDITDHEFFGMDNP